MGFAWVSSHWNVGRNSSVRLSCKLDRWMSKHFALVECTKSDGKQGDGTSQGTCGSGQVCLSNGQCVGMLRNQCVSIL